jgi:hypothetical protein
MTVLKATEKKEIEKSDITKVCEKGKDKTKVLYDGIKRINLLEDS